MSNVAECAHPAHRTLWLDAHTQICELCGSTHPHAGGPWKPPPIPRPHMIQPDEARIAFGGEFIARPGQLPSDAENDAAMRRLERASHRAHVVYHHQTSVYEPAVSVAKLDEPHDPYDDDPDADDRRETRERARTVISILERLSEELGRLELVPTSDAEDVNVLSASKGFVARARNLLRGRFQ